MYREITVNMKRLDAAVHAAASVDALNLRHVQVTLVGLGRHLRSVSSAEAVAILSAITQRAGRDEEQSVASIKRAACG